MINTCFGTMPHPISRATSEQYTTISSLMGLVKEHLKTIKRITCVEDGTMDCFVK